MYPVRASTSISKQTDKDLREISERIEVPLAHLIRIAIEEKVEALKGGMAVADLRQQLQGSHSLVVPLDQYGSIKKLDQLLTLALSEVKRVADHER